ncbi:MAG: two-component system, NarL family, nitrate/nitrite response regulator NarL [Actinomycetota bacterium]|jgi:DNA-binding NarL/FixJ family response regulator|nr:two-component system, NarL family, nitrate/nitrite response regulator NarL [Actinomycetota bacterium]
MHKILAVVEDDTDMRMLIKVLLSHDSDLEITGEANTAEEALKLAVERPSDLIILDHFIQGPTMGLELAPLLKKVAPHSKILMFSAHDLEVEASREPAIDVFLRKKSFDQLLPMVRGLLDPDTKDESQAGPE